MYMKKFIGNVNGKEYNDVKSFNEAVAALLESNEDTMLISSYYTNDNSNELGHTEDTKEIASDVDLNVNLEDVILDFKNPDVDKINDTDFINRLKSAKNSQEIYDGVLSQLECEKKWISKYQEKIQYVNELQKIYIEKLEQLNTDLENTQKMVKYYNKVLETLPKQTECCCKSCDGECNSNSCICNCKKTEFEKDNPSIGSLLDDLTIGFDKILKDLDFFK